MVKLVISDNDGTTTVVPVVRDEISIGRRQGNTIRLTERNVSRDHAQLRCRDDAFFIVNLDAYNGVQVNGRGIEGEQEVTEGDEIRIGDYTMALQIEAEAQSVADALAARPTTPARLVMLSDPSPGAEFSLPVSGTVSLGRSEELEIPINHPSVSRVHAEVHCSAEGYTLRDCGSANGAIVGGERVSEQQLVPGDVIEFGQVVLRFVGPGEHFFFDAGEAETYRVRPQGSGGVSNRLLVAVVAAAAAIGLFFYFKGQGQEGAADGGTGVTPAGVAGMAATPAGYGYETSLQACREALQSGRHSEALAHGTLAMKARPGDAEAARCKADAGRRFGDQQAFSRGETALELGDLMAASAAFSLLSADSPLRQRPEVTRTRLGIADAELQEAEGMLSTDPAAAKAQAEAVSRMPGLDDARRQAALALAARAGSAPTPRKARTSKARRRKRKSTHTTSAGTQKPATGGAEPAEGAAEPATSGPTPMQQATACLAKGDNSCVIAALSGKAKTANEMALLIETYRAVGNAKAAAKYMDLYVKRFPTARRANAYKQTLARQGN